MLTKCPYIALSATVGNSEIFHQWLQNLEKYRAGKQRNVRLINYGKRFSDLKRFIYAKPDLMKIHPISCLNISNVKKHGRIPGDINLTSEEILEVLSSIQEVYGDEVLETHNLKTMNSNRNFSVSLFITRDSIHEYSKKVLKCVEHLILNDTAENRQIDKFIEKLNPLDLKNFDTNIDDNDLLKLVVKMKNDNMLPCIVFTNHRYLCEKKAYALTEYLTKNNVKLNDDFKLDNEIGNCRKYYSIYSRLIENGVAFHHSGLSTELKSVIEALFRLGKIKIIFATATLALGINMPCKTVCFMDDQIYLDSFQYRQAAGRAGRRGFDFNGNIIFFDIPKSKVQRLIGSFLPELRPQFPISLSSILQLYNYSKKKSEIAFNCVVDHSYWQFLYPSKGKQIRYDSIFSLNFLMDLQLIYKNGDLSSFASLLERISYHEPSTFLFYYLIIKSVFHEICWQVETQISKQKREEIKKEVMLIICHLFNRVQTLKNKKAKKMDKEFLLPSLPEGVVEHIDSYNSMVYEQYTRFFRNLSKELLKKSPNVNFMPISQLQFNNKMNNNLKPLFEKWVYEAYLTSPFGTLSGLEDTTLLKVDKLLYFNMTSNIHIDNKILPLYHKYDNQLSNYAFRLAFDSNFMKTLDLLIMEQKFLIGDLFNYLNDFTKLFDSIKIAFNNLAHREDPVKLIFSELNSQIQSRFQKIRMHLIFNNY